MNKKSNYPHKLFVITKCKTKVRQIISTILIW